MSNLVLAEERKKLLKKIKDEVVDLSSSPLYSERMKNRMLPVIGEGNHFAEIMFVGEAPGLNEAKSGRPFCGASGRVLDELLGSVNLPRPSVYVTNIVKDRPPENRDPTPEEIAVYAPFLDRQIEIIQPKILATLGRFSMVYVMKKFELDFELEPISKIHGRVFDAQASYGQIKIIPFYHPAFALYGGTGRAVLMEDFKVLNKFV